MHFSGELEEWILQVIPKRLFEKFESIIRNPLHSLLLLRDAIANPQGTSPRNGERLLKPIKFPTRERGIGGLAS